MFFRAIWDKQPSLVFKNIKKLSSLRSGNFIMFLKTNLGYLAQIAQKNMQLLIQNDPGGGALARFYRPRGWVFELFCCSGGWGIRPSKSCPGGWSGLELTDTLHMRG